MSRAPHNGVCEAGDEARDHCEVWMRDGKGMGGKRAGWSDGDQGRGRTGKSNQISHGCNGSQPPKNTMGATAGAPGGQDSRGGGNRR